MTNTALIQGDYYLDKYKIGEDESKIVFHIPINMHIDLYANKEFLLDNFRNVNVTIVYPNTHIQIVTCYKKVN